MFSVGVGGFSTLETRPVCKIERQLVSSAARESDGERLETRRPGPFIMQLTTSCARRRCCGSDKTLLLRPRWTSRPDDKLADTRCYPQAVENLFVSAAVSAGQVLFALLRGRLFACHGFAVGRSSRPARRWWSQTVPRAGG
jgi:hypothetical protein